MEYGYRRIKDKNRRRIERALAGGAVNALFETTVQEITAADVVYRDPAGLGQTVKKSAIFVFAGGELPTAFLRGAGVQFDTKFGQPA